MEKLKFEVQRFYSEDIITTSDGSAALTVALYGVGDGNPSNFQFSVNGGEKSKEYNSGNLMEAFAELQGQSGGKLDGRTAFDTRFSIGSWSWSFSQLLFGNGEPTYSDFDRKSYKWDGSRFMYQ